MDACIGVREVPVLVTEGTALLNPQHISTKLHEVTCQKTVISAIIFCCPLSATKDNLGLARDLQVNAFYTK